MARCKRFQQPGVLAACLDEAGVTHGTTVRCDIIGAHMARAPVVDAASGRLVIKEGGPVHVHFCQAGVFVSERLIEGDGGLASDKVFVAEGLRQRLQRLGPWTVFNIRGAIVSTNGCTRVTSDGRTEIKVTGKLRPRVSATLAAPLV